MMRVPLRVVTANLLFRMSVEKFNADLEQLGRQNADLLTLQEVTHRRASIIRFAGDQAMSVWQPSGGGQKSDTALLHKSSRFTLIHQESKEMTGEPPGVPSKRYCVAEILYDKVSHAFIIYMGSHTLAAVERSNRLNPISRTPYYIQHVFNLVVYAVELRRLCKKQTGHAGQVILTGDFNWSWSGPTAWINRALNGYFTPCHLALPKVPTLGKRAVDAVLTRGSLLHFSRQKSLPQNSDHNALVVDMEISKVKVPDYIARRGQ